MVSDGDRVRPGSVRLRRHKNQSHLRAQGLSNPKRERGGCCCPFVNWSKKVRVEEASLGKTLNTLLELPPFFTLNDGLPRQIPLANASGYRELLTTQTRNFEGQTLPMGID